MGKSEQGVHPERYQVIPRVLVFAVNQAGEVLLIKGSPTKRIWPNRYNGIGGHVEAGEDIRSAAYREFFEETGSEIETLTLRGVVSVDTSEPVGVLFFVFRGTCNAVEQREMTEGSLEWVPVNQVSTLPLVEDLPELLRRVLPAESAGELFFGQYAYDEGDRLVMRFHPAGSSGSSSS